VGTAEALERFHVTLTVEDRLLMSGWWPDEATARRKSVRWIGEYGSIPAAHVTLTDKETGTVLTRWPEPQ
jgi:hypothetical protein